MKRIISVFLAIFVLALSLCAVGCSKDQTSGGIPIVKDKKFDYNASDLSKYVNLSLADFTGLDLELEGDFPEIDRAMVEEEFRYLRLYNAKLEPGNEDVYLSIPQWGDQVFVFYDLTKTEGGESIGSNLYSTEGRQTVKIGFYEFSEQMLAPHPLFDNAQISEALTKVKPSARRTQGTVMEGDSLRVTYTAKLEDGSTYMQAACARIDTKNILDEDSLYVERYGWDFVEALFDHSIGEKYTVDTVMDIADSSGNTTEKKISYEVTVEYAVEEAFTTVAIDLPDDAFDETYREDLRALNGTRVYLSVTVDGYSDYSVPEFDVNFIMEYCGITLQDGETVESFYERAYESKRLALEADRKAQITEKMLAKFANTVFTLDRIKQIPASVYYEHIDFIINTVSAAYETERAQALNEGKTFPYNSLDNYAIDYLQYSPAEFSSLQAYAEQVALETVTDRLFIFRVIELTGDRLTPEELNTEYTAYLERLKGMYPEYTEAEILAKFEPDGGLYWYVNFTIAYGYFSDYIYYHNTYH